jgi:alkyl hydroperoxide reductase subunit F
MLDTLAVSGDVGGQAVLSRKVENYPGYQLISGIELVERFRDHLENFKIDLKDNEMVKSLQRQGDHFIMRTGGGAKIEARAVIVASGKLPRRLNVPGEGEFRGRGVAYCATCDAPLFWRQERGRDRDRRE